MTLTDKMLEALPWSSAWELELVVPPAEAKEATLVLEESPTLGPLFTLKVDRFVLQSHVRLLRPT
jgi:hypothetical protein